MKVMVFDLGGTLMEYEGMPYSWISYYEDGFSSVNDKYSLCLSKDALKHSVEVLKEYNPRYKPREIEYSSEFLFRKATKHWNVTISIQEVISAFFDSIRLSAKIYTDTMPTITQLKNNGYKIAALTNLPSAMPDYLFRSDIPLIIEILDLYVSSEICGFRKPNKAGLEDIAEFFNVNIADLIFVGDEKLDIDTAKNAGCKSILICRNGKTENFKQDFSIACLEDIFSLNLTK